VAFLPVGNGHMKSLSKEFKKKIVILVVVDYVIKWVEAEIFAEITIYKAVSILLKNIIYKDFFSALFLLFFFLILDMRK